MAATVTGVFRIIDRASRPMDEMRRTAERLDKSLLSVGDHMDDVGTSKQLDQMNATERKLRDMDRVADQLGGGSRSTLGRTRTNVRGLGDDSDRLSIRLGRLAAAFTGVQKILMLLKLPVIITGVVVLTQAIGALLGGVVALLPKLTDTLGILGALPAAFVGVGLAAITVKVALGGIGDAIKGTKEDMKGLTPQAREFVRTIKELKPVGMSLRRSAQTGLLPGLTDAVQAVSRKRPVNTARRVLKGMGQAVGDTASRAATALTRPGFLKDFEGLANQGEHLMSRFGSVLINVAHALLDVAVAAEPFTAWLANLIQNWSVGWREAARLNRESGKMRGFFDRTRSSLETFGSILDNVWDTMRGLGRAARPLGDDLWHSADKATERWAEFTNSVGGQERLRRYFDSLREPIHEIFELVAALGGAIMDLGDSPGLARTAQLLTEAVAPLEKAFENIGENLGPAFATTVRELLTLFANLSEAGGAFSSVLTMLNTFLAAINGLLDAVPGLTNLISVTLGAVALRGLGLRLRGLAADWGLVAASAGSAAAAQRAAMMSPGMYAPGGRRGPAGTTGGTVPPVVVGGGAGGGRRPLFGAGGRLYNTAPRAGQPFNPRTTTIPTSVSEAARARMPWMAAGMGGAAMAGLGTAARFLGPAAAIFGGVSSLQYGAESGFGMNMLPAFYSGATMGLLPGPTTQGEVDARAAERTSGIASRVPRGREARRTALGRLSIGMKDPRELMGQTSTSWTTLGVGPQVGEKSVEEAQVAFTKAHQRITAALAQGDRQMGAKAAIEFSQGFAIYAKKENARVATDELIGPMERRLEIFSNREAPQAAKAFGSSMLQMVAHAKRSNPKLKDEYDRLENAVERSFRRMGQQVEVVNGRIYTGSKAEWTRISDMIGGQAEKARQRTSAAFTAMQQEAVGSLIAMGYSRDQAKRIVQGLESRNNQRREAAEGAARGGPGSYNNDILRGASGPPSKRGATGMRIPGTGSMDTVPLLLGMAAPGELVVNQHTERDVNRDLAMAGRPSLGARVAGETRAHSDRFARGGRTTAGMGGMGGVGAWASSMGLSVGEGPGYGGIPSGGHAAGSLHYSGRAYDISGAPALMMKFRRAAEQRYLGHGLDELFYDPYPYYIDAGRKVPGAIGDHTDHVHIGFSTSAGPMGASAIRGLMGTGTFNQVKMRRSGMGGAPGAMADAAMGSFARGLNRRLASKAGMTATASMPSFRGGGGMLGMAQLEMLARQAGMPNPHLMAAIAMAESSGNPSVTNSIGARGLWQIIPSTASAFGLNYNRLTNPAYNAFGAAKILSGQGLGAWEGYTNGAYAQFMARGGRVGRTPSFAGWFQDGGTITAHGPTLLGIGEGPGTETATVVKGNGATGGRPIHIGHVSIENHRPGDIQKQMKEEIGKALNELSDELDNDVDDSEVLG